MIPGMAGRPRWQRPSEPAARIAVDMQRSRDRSEPPGMPPVSGSKKCGTGGESMARVVIES